MTSLDKSLIAAYNDTSYILPVDGDTLVFRIGPHISKTRAWLVKMGITGAGFITAHNPLGETQAEAVNESLHSDLLEFVIGEGLQYWLGEGIGADRLPNGEPEWPAELSLLISPLSRDGAVHIGNRFSQNAVVHITADAAELVLLR